MTSARTTAPNAIHGACRAAPRRRKSKGIAPSAFLLAACLTLLTAASPVEPGEPNSPAIVTTTQVVAVAKTLPIVIDGWCLNVQTAETPRLRCQVRAEKATRVSSSGELYYLMVFTEDGREVETISIYPVGEERVIYRRESK